MFIQRNRRSHRYKAGHHVAYRHRPVSGMQMQQGQLSGFYQIEFIYNHAFHTIKAYCPVASNHIQSVRILMEQNKFPFCFIFSIQPRILCIEPYVAQALSLLPATIRKNRCGAFTSQRLRFFSISAWRPPFRFEKVLSQALPCCLSFYLKDRFGRAADRTDPIVR